MGLSGDDYTAFCFDEVVFGFGTYVDSAMNEAEAQTKKDALKPAMRLQALTSILDGGGKSNPESSAPKGGAFRDPAEMFKKK